jgi:hypothetical protein
MIKVVVLLRDKGVKPRKEIASFFHPHPELLMDSPYITLNDDPPYAIWGAYNRVETFDRVAYTHYVIIVYHPDDDTEGVGMGMA